MTFCAGYEPRMSDLLEGEEESQLLTVLTLTSSETSDVGRLTKQFLR
jgi:hypothetical protein